MDEQRHDLGWFRYIAFELRCVQTVESLRKWCYENYANSLQGSMSKFLL